MNPTKTPPGVEQDADLAKATEAARVNPTKTPPGVEQQRSCCWRSTATWYVNPTKTPPGVEQLLVEIDDCKDAVVNPTKTPPGVEQLGGTRRSTSAICEPDKDAPGR